MNNVVANQKSDLRALINSDAMKKQFQAALPKVLPIDRFLRVLMTTIQNNPKLLDCTRDSLLSSVMAAAQLGLEIDAVLGRAYLVPFAKGQDLICTLIVGYKGYVDLAYRSGQLAGIQAEVVYEKDLFEFEMGLNPKLRHVPCEDEDRGQLRYAYAVAEIKGGGKVWRVLNRGDVMRAKKMSKSAGSQHSPWNTHEASMWSKTAIRALHRFLPLSPEQCTAVALDDDDRSDQGHAYGSATIETTITKESPKEQIAQTPANLTPKQELNTLLITASQEGIAPNDLQKAMKKIDKPVASMTDDECRILIEDIKMMIRVKIEGVG